MSANTLRRDSQTRDSRLTTTAVTTATRRGKRARRPRDWGAWSGLSGFGPSCRSAAARYRHGNHLRGEELEDRSLLTIWFVDDSAAAGGDGLAWGTAFDNLQTALTASVANDEIWVASGTYTPTAGTDRAISFNLKTDVDLYGGFAGTETMLSERNWQTNDTTLSGDIGTLGDNADNSYHVVFASGVTGAALDGFTITAGNADGSAGGMSNSGGGMYSTSSSLTLTNATVSGNSATFAGGGIYNFGGTLSLTQYTLAGNCVTNSGGLDANISGYGGAIYNSGGTVSLLQGSVIQNYVSVVVVSGRGGSAGAYGGGIFSDGGDISVTNGTIDNNQANGRFEEGPPPPPPPDFASLPSLAFTGALPTPEAPGVGDGGGIYSHGASVTVANTVFVGNLAQGYNYSFFPSGLGRGGAIYDDGTSLAVFNASFSGNQATSTGGALQSHAATVANSILWNNSAESAPQIAGTAAVSYSIVQGGWSGTGNLDVDPLFNNAATGNLRLLPNSPGIDAGNNAAVPPDAADLDGDGDTAEASPLDLRLRPRFLDVASVADTGNGTSPIVDLGAYENRENTTLYVNQGAIGTNDGSSWANAFTSLAAALSESISGDSVWVAAGTYKPTAGVDRAISFNLDSHENIYGGFAGTETMLTQRSWQTNVTTLSGDIGALGNNADNSYHVVVASGVTGVTLDGFTITSGNANGSYPHYYGGGIYQSGGSLTLANNVFSGNAASYGGGMFKEYGGMSTLTNVEFTGNTASNGGGMYNRYSTSPTTLTNVDFSGNTASSAGGGMYNDQGSPTLTNVIFSGNAAPSGGGMRNDGGTATITNSVFSGNTASTGGGMHVYSGSPILNNVVFKGNSASGEGGGMYNYAGDPILINIVFSDNGAPSGGGLSNGYWGSVTLTNAILWDNTASSGPQIAGWDVSVNHSIVQGGWSGTGNLNVDPRFVDSAAGDLRVQFGSPAIDAGTNTGAPAFDFNGVARPQDGDNDGLAIADIGAFELEYQTVWVNDDWIEEVNVAGGTVNVLDIGDIVGDGGAVTNKVYGTDTFATITDGVAGLTPVGGVVIVLTGSYDESVNTTSKAVTLAVDGAVTVSGGMMLDANDTLAFDVRGPTAGAEYDQWIVPGPVTLGNAALAVTIDPAYTPALGTVFKLIDGTEPNAISDIFTGRPDASTATFGGHGFWLDYNDTLHGDAYDFTLLRDLPPVANVTLPNYIDIPFFGVRNGSYEGDGVTLDGSGSTDPDAGDVLSYEWTVNGNAAGADDVFSLSWSELVALGVNDGRAPADYPVTLVVTDAAGLSSTQSGTLSVYNVSPSVTVAGLPATVLEGTTAITLATTVSDPSPVDTFTYAWQVDEFVLGSWHSYTTGSAPDLTFTPDDNGDYRITLDVYDKDYVPPYGDGFPPDGTLPPSGHVRWSTSFLVTNLLPTVAVTGALTVMDGTPYTLSLGSVVDPGDDTVSLYRVFWGDGTTETFSGSPPATLTHTYSDGPGRYSIFVDVTDEDGTYAAALRSVTVTEPNANPTAVSLSNTLIVENRPAGSLVGTLSTTDPDAGDTHSYTRVSGTGDTDNGAFTISGNELRINAAPNFEAKGSYSILVRSTDQGGLYVDQAFTITVGNLAPSAPMDTDGSRNFTTEAAADGSLVGITALATDPAGGAVTFTLTDNAGGRFAIDPATGVVSVADGSLLTGPAVHAITVQASDGLAIATSTFSVTVTNAGPMVTGAGAGYEPRVHVYDAVTGRLVRDFLAYNPAFTGGVHVATGDVNGDLVADIITAAGAGGGPHVRVFDGVTGNVLREFFAYDPRFTGGVYVAAGDVDRDGLAEIVTGAGAGGGPHVRVFRGAVHTLLGEYYAYAPNFGGGVPVAVGDVNGDGAGDVITAVGPGGGPHVRVFRGATSDLLREFYAYSPMFGGGVWVAAGDIDGDDRADIITGAGAGGSPHVRVFSGADQSELQSFYAYSPMFGGGVRVAASDLDGDGRDDLITAAGVGGGPHVRGFSGIDLAELANFYAYDPMFVGGVFVAGVARAPVGSLRLAGEPSQAVSIQTPLASGTLEPILAAAIARWEFAGASAAQLRDLRMSVANLPGDLLGQVRGRQVLIDSDAGGLGWFVDPTPEEDDEFLLPDLPATASAAIGRVDLLTVVLHEIGHVLGLDHEEAGEGIEGVMAEDLLPGMRRLPASDVLDNYFAQL